MQRVLICLLILFGFFSAAAQNYNVALIPDSLKQNAHAVKRMEEMRVIIKGTDRVIIKHKYAITILDEEGAEYAGYINDYSSLTELSGIDGNLYDAAGKKIQPLKKKDIIDIPAWDGISIALDARYKKHNFYYRQYPYTIEYEDEQLAHETYFLPSWHPYNGQSFAVQDSRYIVEMSLDYKLRYKLFNYTALPEISELQTKSYTWHLQNGAPIFFEQFIAPASERIPAVYIGATNFSIAGYNGNMQTWQELGKFNITLNKGRDVLPENVRQDIHKLVDSVEDREEKIGKVYRYLQQNTRYISVQLGIGGWQPFDAKYVATNRYGDCKALSNYMVSLLKEVGIKANYVVIAAGPNKKGLAEDFPSPSYFNHIVCCVPNGKDSIWLECTDQTKSAGFMGSFTGDRKALLIDEDGGHVVHTPSYSSADNGQLRKIKAIIDEDGNMTAEVSTQFSGIRQEQRHGLIHYYTKEERQKYLDKELNIPTYSVNKMEYIEKPGKIPFIYEYLEVKATNYASVSGKRIYFLPDPFTQSAIKLPPEEERKNPIMFTESFIKTDTLLLYIPQGYKVEAIPGDISLENKFGSFQLRYTVKSSQIEMIRSHTMNKNSFPASDYSAVAKYFDKIYKADHSRIVLVKAE